MASLTLLAVETWLTLADTGVVQTQIKADRSQLVTVISASAWLAIIL